MSEKRKNQIAVLLAAVFVTIGLLYAFDPDGDFRDAILKAVALPRNVFSFLFDRKNADGAETSMEIVIPDETQPDQKEVTSFNPNETPLDSFDGNGALNFEGPSPVGDDETDINELPIHQVDR